MGGQGRVAVIGDQGGQAVDQAGPLVGTRRQQCAGVGTDLAAVGRDRQRARLVLSSSLQDGSGTGLVNWGDEAAVLYIKVGY